MSLRAAATAQRARPSAADFAGEVLETRCSTGISTSRPAAPVFAPRRRLGCSLGPPYLKQHGPRNKREGFSSSFLLLNLRHKPPSCVAKSTGNHFLKAFEA